MLLWKTPGCCGDGDKGATCWKSSGGLFAFMRSTITQSPLCGIICPSMALSPEDCAGQAVDTPSIYARSLRCTLELPGAVGISSREVHDLIHSRVLV